MELKTSFQIFLWANLNTFAFLLNFTLLRKIANQNFFFREKFVDITLNFVNISWVSSETEYVLWRKFFILQNSHWVYLTLAVLNKIQKLLNSKFKIQKLLIATTNCKGNDSINNHPSVTIFILLIITNQSRYKTRQVQQK